MSPERVFHVTRRRTSHAAANASVRPRRSLRREFGLMQSLWCQKRQTLSLLLFLAASFRCSCASQAADVVLGPSDDGEQEFFESIDAQLLGDPELLRYADVDVTSPPRRLQNGLATVTNIQFEDLDAAAGSVAGNIQWDLPADTSGIAMYHVRLAFGRDGTHEKTMIAANYPSGCRCVLDPETIWTMDPSNPEARKGQVNGNVLQYPSNWILIYSGAGSPTPLGDAGFALEATAFKMTDNQTQNVATNVTLATLTVDVSSPGILTTAEIEGNVSWTTTGPDYPNEYEDWTYVDEFQVFLAKSSDSYATKRSVGSVAVGTSPGVNSFSYWIPRTTLSGDDTILVRAVNSIGEAVLGGVYPIPVPTTTSVTSTTTVLYSLLHSVVTFSDTDQSAGTLAGTISWDPPLDDASVLQYKIYMSYDTIGSYQMLVADVTPPSTSYTFSGLTRQTSDANYPANYLLIYPEVENGVLPGLHLVAQQDLYDESGTVPQRPSFTSVSFTDEDTLGGWAGGTVSWVLSDGEDLALTTHYVVYMAQDEAGNNEIQFGDPVPVGSTSVTKASPTPGSGVEIFANYHVVIKATNSNPGASDAGCIGSPCDYSFVYIDVGSSTSTSKTATDTSSTTATTSSTTNTVTTSTDTTKTTTSFTGTTETSTTITSTSFTSTTSSTISTTTSMSSTSATSSTTLSTSTSLTMSSTTTLSTSSSSISSTSTSVTTSSATISSTSSISLTSSSTTSSTTSSTSSSTTSSFTTSSSTTSSSTSTSSSSTSSTSSSTSTLTSTSVTTSSLTSSSSTSSSITSSSITTSLSSTTFSITTTMTITTVTISSTSRTHTSSTSSTGTVTTITSTSTSKTSSSSTTTTTSSSITSTFWLPPPSAGSDTLPNAASSLGMAIVVVSLLLCACCFVLAVVCCSKIQQARARQAKHEKEVLQEAARAEEMQDNFDMVRTKISVMLPKLEPGHGPMVGRIQSVMEENHFEPADDVLPEEREAMQSGRRRSLRNFAQGDAFTLDILDEVLSTSERAAAAQLTGRNERDTSRNLRRLGLDDADMDGGNRDGTQSAASVDMFDDFGREMPSIKPSPMVTSYMSFNSPTRAERSSYGID